MSEPNNQEELIRTMKPYSTEEISDVLDNIQVALDSIHSIFKNNIGIPEDDEDMEVIESVVEYIQELI